MGQSFWKKDDFQVFEMDGLQNRMSALQEQIQPKFQKTGEHIASFLSSQGKGEFFPHVAKHARRTVNPPNDSWVAVAPAKRGYKALPHFQVGLWKTHLFIVVAVIYENPDKKAIGEKLEQNSRLLRDLPGDYVMNGDHMKPDAWTYDELQDEGVQALAERLQTVKKAELVVGRHLSIQQATSLTEEQFMELCEETVSQLLPLYELFTGAAR